MENYGDDLFKGANAKLFEFSKVLRKTQTDAEDTIWQCVRNRQILGFKFRRQHPINKYIADFYCNEAHLIIEIDGGIHNIEGNQEYDINRTYELEQMGITVIRFTNEEIIKNLDIVLTEIKEHLQKASPLNPSAAAEGGNVQKCKGFKPYTANPSLQGEGQH